MADAKILCTKCGTASLEPRLQCARCGGRTARVCGGCATPNSIAKNFCDKCGLPLAGPAPGAAPAKTAAAAAPAADMPRTADLRPTALPAARRASAPGSIPPPPDLWSGPPPSDGPAAAPAPKRAWLRALPAAALLAAIAGAAGGAWLWNESQKPEVLVPRLAARYLDDLRTRDYAGAYEMFSDAAKQNCTEDEFRASRDSTTWTWSGLRVERAEPGAMLISYTLAADGAPPRRDYVLFARDGGRWTRPYNWTLMKRVESSFESGNPDEGLIIAQAAAAINPRDPMAWGYLCEAAYYRKLPQDADLRCRMALELSRAYPSDLTPKSLYHLHSILADINGGALNRPNAAVEQYAEMLAFPGISPEDQCSVLLARSQAYAALSRASDAEADLERGSALCADPKDRQFIKTMRARLRRG